LQALAPRRISAIYFFVLVFVIFSLVTPGTFLVAGTWRSLLNNQAVVAMVALAFLIPLIAGHFDLAIGTEAGFAGVLVATLLADGFPIVPSILLVVGVGALVGAVSGFLVVVARIDSFIATLGVSSVLTAMTRWVTGGMQVLGLPKEFNAIASTSLLGITVSVWTLVGCSVVVWYVLERTPLGRRVYATGGNIDAARLAGVNTGRITVVSFVACGAIAAIAGILETSFIGSGDPSIGPSYLMPALAGVFLGSTQFRGARNNVWGTIIALYALATGTTGLQLLGAPHWIPDFFNGAALLIAVGVAKSQRSTATKRRLTGLRK
jgi:ribose transport system permease protein